MTIENGESGASVRAELNAALDKVNGDAPFTSVDINGGTIDGTVIGGTTPAAGSFTSGQFGTSLNVDGTVTADGLTGTNASTFVINNDTTDGADNKRLVLQSGGGAFSNGRGAYIALSGVEATNAGQILLNVGNATEAKVQMNNRSGVAGFLFDGTTGDISFYEDTGTTPKFFWDASAEALGIGTSSPTAKLHVFDTGSSTEKLIVRGPETGTLTDFSNGLNANVIIKTTTSLATVGPSVSASLAFQTANTERLRITSTGNVGIGTSSPTLIAANGTVLQVKGLSPARSGQLRLSSFDSSQEAGYYVADGVVQFGAITNHPVVVRTNNTERMRIDASGNLLIGTSSSGGSKLRVSGLPTSSAGLSAGDVWNDGGTLKIV